MVTKVCDVCGTSFEARRSDAMYCSNKCKMKKRRDERRNRIKFRPVFSDKPPDIPDASVPIECEAAVQEAHKLANDFGRLARTAPYQLRARFARLSAAIYRALEDEGL